MESIKIKNLLNYAFYHLELDKADEIYIRNRLLEACFTEEYDENFDKDRLMDVATLDCPDVIIDPILDELIETGKIKAEDHEFYLCKLMDIVSLKPSEIAKRFEEIKKNSSTAKAFQWLHKYSEHNSYIKLSHIKKNIRWYSEAETDDLEITINLSKPEKTVGDVKKALKAEVKYPKCIICPENMGYTGHQTHRQNLRGCDLVLGGEPWFWQFSPYAYFNEHGIAINKLHTPMVVSEKNIDRLLDFIDYVPEYFIGFNAALPIVGGSILAHDHYQGGRYVLPMFKAKDDFVFKNSDYPDVKISKLKWYNSVIRCESSHREQIAAVAKHIISSWQDYSDQDNNIYAHTQEQHNSITAIARFEGHYIIDLILRNNRTNIEYPEGIFHAHPEFHNIKREAIGLIEAGGMFILPARLKRQLALVCDYLSNSNLKMEVLDLDMKCHQAMLERLINENGQHNSLTQAEAVVKAEVERICREILRNTAVFKDTEVGIKGFKAFLFKNNIKED